MWEKLSTGITFAELIAASRLSAIYDVMEDAATLAAEAVMAKAATEAVMAKTAESAVAANFGEDVP